MNHNNMNNFGTRKRSLVFARATAVVDIEKLVWEIKNLTLKQAQILTDMLPKELGVIAASFTPARAVARGGAAEVTTETTPIMEKKTTLTLLLVMVIVVPIVAIVQA